MAINVLIVDDDLKILDSLGSSLVAHKYNVHIAYDAKLALDLMLKEKVDVLVTDVEMPGKDGFQLVDQTRKIIKYRKLPIIMLSETMSKQEVEKVAAFQKVELLLKPVKVPQLLNSIDNFFSTNGANKGKHALISEREVLKNLSVLVVDEEETIRLMLQEFLEIHVQYVSIASSVEEAKTLFETHKYDILLSDIQLPDISGFDLVEWVNEFPKNAGMPIVMMTGVKLDAPSVKRAKQLRIDKYLAKPFDLEALRSILLTIGTGSYRFKKLKSFKQYVADLEVSDVKEKQFLMSSSLKRILEQKKEQNRLHRKIRRFSQDDHSLELSELNVEKARLELKINEIQEEITDTKKMFFERRKLFATIKRFNVQRIEKLKS